MKKKKSWGGLDKEYKTEFEVYAEKVKEKKDMIFDKLSKGVENSEHKKVAELIASQFERDVDKANKKGRSGIDASYLLYQIPHKKDHIPKGIYGVNDNATEVGGLSALSYGRFSPQIIQWCHKDDNLTKQTLKTMGILLEDVLMPLLREEFENSPAANAEIEFKPPDEATKKEAPFPSSPFDVYNLEINIKFKWRDDAKGGIEEITTERKVKDLIYLAKGLTGLIKR